MAGGGRPDPGTAARILDSAETLVQVRGFNAFSYADIAAELHVSKASLHYHFAGKAELGRALVTRYSERFWQALDAIDATVDSAHGKLDAYVDLYAGVIADHRMCLCGMLAAEFPTLPEPMQAAVRGFIDANQAWLAAVIEQGVREGSLRRPASIPDTAVMLVAGLEGAMLVARPYADDGRFRAAAAPLLAGLLADATGLQPTVEADRA